MLVVQYTMSGQYGPYLLAREINLVYCRSSPGTLTTNPPLTGLASLTIYLEFAGYLPPEDPYAFRYDCWRPVQPRHPPV
jgi:hypothetical protein